MKAFGIAFCIFVVLLEMFAWGVTIHLGWQAAAPGHLTDSNRAWLIGTFAFLGLFPTGGVLILLANLLDD